MGSGRLRRDPELEDFLARPAWHSHVVCKGKLALYFSTATGDVDKAREICRRCPVGELCYQYAMANSSLAGVWGGFDEKERREIRRRRVA